MARFRVTLEFASPQDALEWLTSARVDANRVVLDDEWIRVVGGVDVAIGDATLELRAE